MKSKKINNYIYNLFKDLATDEKGSILPMIAVVLILIIILGAVNFSLVIMYRDRAVVRNALDAGATSSLVATAVEKHKPINYGESLITLESQFVECIVQVVVGESEDENGNIEEIYEDEDRSATVPVVQEWINTESEIKNYIQLDPDEAEDIAKEYFEKNMKGNNLKHEVKDWNFSVNYDDQRIYTVIKNRDINRPYVPGQRPSGANCDFGSPEIINSVTNPETWWPSDFAGANTGSWSSPPGWTDAVSEKRDVLFPRWVEVKANVIVELPVPLGKLVGRETYKASFDVTAFKELVNTIP